MTFASLVASLASAFGADAAWNVCTELFGVRVSIDAGVRLRSQFQGPQQTEMSLTELRRMVSQGEATLIGSLVTRSISGIAAASWAGEEVRYPTDAESRGGPQNVGTSSWQPPAFPNFLFHNLIQQFIEVPWTFETRNTGLSLELEPTVSTDGKLIAFAMSVHNSSLEGFQKPFGSPARSEPKFCVRQTRTTFETTSGHWRLLNVTVLRKPSPSMEFYLFRATALPVPQ